MMRLSKLERNNILIFLLSVLAAWAVLLLYIPTQMRDDNFIYAIQELHIYDNTLFTNNVFGVDGAVSPRYVADYLFSLVMRILDGNWSGTVMCFVYVATLILAIAIANIVFSICEKNHVLYTMILAFLFPLNGNNLAGFSLFAVNSVSIGIALSFAVLAISFVVGKRKSFNTAWILVSISALFHIHEGLYGFAVIFIILFVDFILKKKISLKEHWGIVLYVVAAACIVLPSLLTDSMTITNEEFVYIYSQVRHPHHLVPSTWGNVTIIRSFGINISLILFRIVYLFLYEKDKLKRFSYEVILFLIAWLGALGIAFIFTEIIPISFISTIFLSKAFKYVVLMTLIWTIQTVAAVLTKAKSLSGFFILFYCFMTHNLSELALVVCFLIVLSLLFLEYKFVSVSQYGRWNNVLAGIIFMLFAFEDTFENVVTIHRMVILLIIMIWILSESAKWHWFIVSKVVVVGLAVLLIIVSGQNQFYTYEEGRFKLRTGEDYLCTTMGDGLYEVAIDFKAITSKDEVFLADPEKKKAAGWMQVVSERNCYVVRKVVPSSKSNLKEWYERFTKTENLFDMEIDDIIKIMQEEQIQYLLVDNKNYGKVDASSVFSVSIESSDDKYRIYELAD